MMSKVFLSYQRRDIQGEAGRLWDVLQHRLGSRFVFRDVGSISPGDQFDSVIKTQLAAAKIVLVLIGPAWLEELNRKLGLESTDYHRMEVATALREGKQIIPVLLREAVLPSEAVLPDDLQALTKCHAITIRDETWTTDVERLISAIGRPYRWELLIVRTAFATALITLAVWTLAPYVAREHASNYDFWRRVVLALIGVYVCLELLLANWYFRTLKRS